VWLDNLALSFQTIVAAFQQNFLLSLEWVGVLWVIQFINASLGYRLNYLGTYPRSIHGLIGIFFTPFLHADFNHLFFNSIPLVVLTNLMMLHGLANFYCATVIIIVLGGIALWLFGSKNIHIGASGLIMGYFGYLLSDAYTHLNAQSIIVAGIALYYFSGLIFSLFPSSTKNISWTGHLFGFLAGLVALYLCNA
jgi:membrane associated rhomboid family serine protease